MHKMKSSRYSREIWILATRKEDTKKTNANRETWEEKTTAIEVIQVMITNFPFK